MYKLLECTKLNSGKPNKLLLLFFKQVISQAINMFYVEEPQQRDYCECQQSHTTVEKGTGIKVSGFWITDSFTVRHMPL